ncbi:hypothetical protein C8R44DRAFT_260794 [Mycena epipterygia]|nr:hypothetical protein C8R44DRAFT_260794 [Mycena epipterygia]
MVNGYVARCFTRHLALSSIFLSRPQAVLGVSQRSPRFSACFSSVFSISCLCSGNALITNRAECLFPTS